MNDPLLVRAVLETFTTDEDRDHDSCINVEARTADHQTMIAVMHVGLCSGQYGYGRNELHTDEIPLAPGANRLTKSQCQRFEFAMGLSPTGSDTWHFDAWLILYFDDGSGYYNDKLAQRIDADDPFNRKIPEFQCGFNFSQVKPPLQPLRDSLEGQLKES
jgi:hypothetical protein